jgi:hypothetical protein
MPEFLSASRQPKLETRVGLLSSFGGYFRTGGYTHRILNSAPFPRTRCTSAVVQTRFTGHWPLDGIERIKATMDFMSCAFMLVRGMPPFCIWIL